MLKNAVWVKLHLQDPHTEDRNTEDGRMGLVDDAGERLRGDGPPAGVRGVADRVQPTAGIRTLQK